MSAHDTNVVASRVSGCCWIIGNVARRNVAPRNVARNVSLPRLARGPVGLQEPAGRLIVALLLAVAVVSALLMNSNRAMALPIEDTRPTRRSTSS
jgi:hypothetical protein